MSSNVESSPMSLHHHAGRTDRDFMPSHLLSISYVDEESRDQTDPSSFPSVCVLCNNAQPEVSALNPRQCPSPHKTSHEDDEQSKHWERKESVNNNSNSVINWKHSHELSRNRGVMQVSLTFSAELSLWGEFTIGDRCGFPLQMASKVELWCFLLLVCRGLWTNNRVTSDLLMWSPEWNEWG